MDKPLTTILLLGSFDPQTKIQLENIKEEIAKTFSGENTYTFMLDTVEIYASDEIEVLTEQFGETGITLFIFQNNQLTDIVDTNIEKEGADTTVYNYLKAKFAIREINRLPIFDKLDVLMRNAKVIFLLRHKKKHAAANT